MLPVKIKTALVSIYNKYRLEPLIKLLDQYNVKIYSTGGTQEFIESLGINVISVEDITTYPSILDGRVKTLHPKIFGGILYRRGQKKDCEQISKYQIPPIDLVIVDLYPFEEAVASNASEKEIIEKIDIGGISLIRAAAKNFRDVVIVPAEEEYDKIETILREKNCTTDIEDRKLLAGIAFDITSHYDIAIFKYFNRIQENEIRVFKQSVRKAHELRYGENPHQASTFYGNLSEIFEQLNGKALSYNNLADIDAAINLMSEFDPASGEGTNKILSFAILKHTNACGVASAKLLKDAYSKALAADPVSAFGGVLICNSNLDIATAHAMHKLFFEVIIAPGYDKQALILLKEKKNRIILKLAAPPKSTHPPLTPSPPESEKRGNGETEKRGRQFTDSPIHRFTDSVRNSGGVYLGGAVRAMTGLQFKSILNGIIEQDIDIKSEKAKDFTCVTKKKPTELEINAMIFANKIAKHSKSNTIVLACSGRDGDEQLLASGIGQTSRVDALKQAIAKAKKFGLEVPGSVMASEAFFPFSDCVEIANNAGIKAVIQPGGSIKDKDSIAYCDANNMTMVFTGIRHFKH